VIAESGKSDTAAAAELGLAKVTAVEGVEDLAPLSGCAVAGHPGPSRRSRTSVDGPGRTLTKIWYYDLSDIKVGKKTPFTLDRFKEFFELLPERGDSDRSWTIDFIARREKASTDAAPFRKEVDRCEREIDALKTGRREKKKAGATDAELRKIDEQISELAKAAREATNRASAIEDAVYDLKAVNPTASGDVDSRTPGELIEIIEREGEVIRQALERLKGSFGSIIA